jgi:micrococcal nuclease
LLFAWLHPAAADALVRIDHALDGDSLLLADGRQVRLIGINAPEFGKDGTAAQPLAVEARDLLNALVRRQTVRLVYDRERVDRYGRTLAYAMLADGRDPQLLLLHAGLAWFVAVPPNVARLAAYRDAEAQARAARRGVWGRSEYEPVPAERLTRRHTGFIRLTGVVTSMRSGRHGSELVLAPGVRLFISHGGEFATPPSLLNGKRVLARGWVTEYKTGFSLRITHPAMLDVLP